MVDILEDEPMAAEAADARTRSNQRNGARPRALSTAAVGVELRNLEAASVGWSRLQWCR